MQKRQPPSLFASLFGRSKNDSKTTPAARTSAAPSAHPYQAISIHPGASCCNSAKKLESHRFLARKAPQLPLPDCTMGDACKCRYVKHPDRRSDSRRVGDVGITQTLFSAEERRRIKGRRKADQ